jgi:hypothetical protein
MRPVSTAFLNAVRGSHQMAVQAKVCTSFQTGVNPTGTEIPILAGDVQMDATSATRATMDVTTDGTGMWPTNSSDLLAPYGNEVFLRRGVKFGGGSTEWVSLGYFRINSPEQDRVPDGPIRLSGADRMAGIVDAKLVAPMQFAATDTLGPVVNRLVTDVYPSATIEWDDATDTTALGRALAAEQDRYKFLDELIRAQGKVWYWDYRGILVIKDVPSSTSPVYIVDSGTNGVLVSLKRHLSRDGVFNAVVASGEGVDSSNPVRAVAYDNNPSSATYFLGPFGPVPRFFKSAAITTVDQAQTAATAELRKQLGLPYSVDFGTVPNPALEPDDPIRVRFPTRNELHVIAKLTIPLGVDGTLTATTREQTTILIGGS